MTKRFGLISAVILSMAACTQKKGPPKPPAPSSAVMKPAGARDMGKTTKAIVPNAPAGAPTINTAQPGDDGDEEWAWQEDIDGDGTLDDVLVVYDDETGDAVLASTFQSPCDDGTSLDASFFYLVHANGTGEFMLAASDVCGDGAALYGCAVDAQGNESGCGSCTIPADGTDFTCTSDGSS